MPIAGPLLQACCKGKDQSATTCIPRLCVDNDKQSWFGCTQVVNIEHWGTIESKEQVDNNMISIRTSQLQML